MPDKHFAKHTDTGKKKKKKKKRQQKSRRKTKSSQQEKLSVEHGRSVCSVQGRKYMEVAKLPSAEQNLPRMASC
jgi:hypothetical protein